MNKKGRGPGKHLVFGDARRLYAVSLDGSQVLAVRARGPRTLDEAAALGAGTFVSLEGDEGFEVIEDLSWPRPRPSTSGVAR